MVKDLISVIVPVYNVKPYLDECFESIVKQSYKNIEIIVVDDGSTDGSSAVCDDWQEKDSRIKVVHQENRGLSGARNTGLDMATGEYIAFIDSDDFYPEYALKNLYECAVKFDADIVVGRETFVSESGQDIKRSNSEAVEIAREDQLISEEEFWKRFSDNMNYVVVWSKLYRKYLFDKIRFPEGKINEDFAIARPLIDEANTIARTESIVYKYRVRKGSISRSPFSEKNLFLIRERLELFKYILDKGFSAKGKYYILRRQFPDAMELIGKGFESDCARDKEIKKILVDGYEAYKPIARAILRGIDGSVTPDTYTRVLMKLYLFSRRGFFFLRSIKKRGNENGVKNHT